jgi:hypothetical protein
MGLGVLLATFGVGLARAEEPRNPALRLALTANESNWREPESFGNSASILDTQSPLRFAPERQRPDALREHPSGIQSPSSRPLEYAFTAAGRRTGFEVDLAVAPRAGFTLGPEGGQLRSAGAEIRIGDLGDDLEGVVRPFEGTTWDEPAWYFFVGADGSALTWTPEIQSAAARQGWRFQEERVLVGDHQLGVSMEANNVQASVSFTNRDVSTGRRSYEENFLGASITMRR